MKFDIVTILSIVTIAKATDIDVEKSQRREVKTEKRNIHKKFFGDKSERFFDRTADKRGMSSLSFGNSDAGDTFDDFSSPNHEIPLGESSQEYASDSSYPNQMPNYNAGHEMPNGEHSNFGDGFEHSFFNNGPSSFMGQTKQSFGGGGEDTNTVGTGFSSEGAYRELDSPPKTVYVTKEVPVPYPVHIEKKIPYYVKVPVDKPVPVAVHKPYPVHIEKQVPYPVKIHVPRPYPVTIEKYIPYPVRVQVDKPIPVHVPKPYPIVLEKRIPVPVDKPVPFPVKVPVDRPYTVHVPIEKPIAVTVEKRIPYAIKIPLDKPYTVHVTKPYPVTVEKPIPYPIEKPFLVPVKVPVKVPIKVPYPVEIKVPVQEHHYVGQQEGSQGMGHQFENGYENGASHVNNGFLGFTRGFKGGHNQMGGMATALGGGENVFEFPEGFDGASLGGHEDHAVFRRGYVNTRGDARRS